MYGPCDITEVERVISWRRLGFTAVAPVTFAASAIVRYKGVRKITETKRVVNRFLNTAYDVVIAKGRIEIVLTGFGHPHELNRDLVVQLARILATRATA